MSRCDVVYCDHKGYGMICNIYFNIAVILVSYILVAKKLYNDMKIKTRVFPEFREPYLRHIKLVMVLAISYVLCVLPSSLVSCPQQLYEIDSWFSTVNQKLIITSIINIIYWYRLANCSLCRFRELSSRNSPYSMLYNWFI